MAQPVNPAEVIGGLAATVNRERDALKAIAPGFARGAVAGNAALAGALRQNLAGTSFFSVTRIANPKAVRFFKWGRNSWGIIVGIGN